MLALLLVLPYGMAGAGGSVYAANTNASRYYYSQLKGDAKVIYDAMYEMYVQGIFKTGTQEYDLVEKGHMTSEQAARYETDKDELLRQYGAARDAFYADYPDIFYVDFSNLSVSWSKSGDVYKVVLGIGRTENYFVEGFADTQQVERAEKEQDARISEIVKGAKGNSSSVREQVAYVYNAIIDNTEYRLDTNCDAGNAGHVRTSYGALVKGQSLCEGYARAVKTVLDAMGINSVLVQGNYRAPDGSDNLHMWNYVQIDGKWYGVDATAGDGMKGTVDSGKYLLADRSVMDANHKPDGVMSGSGFRFTYPQLTGADEGSEGEEQEPETDTGNTDGDTDEDGYEKRFDKEGLLVQYRNGTESEGAVGVFKVSYKGMGYQNAVDREGVYMLARFYQYMPGTGEYEVGSWGYADPKPFMMPQHADALLLANGNSRYIEFAVTKKAPAGPLYGDDLTAEELEKNWKFQGTEADFIVSTGKLDNPKGTFVPSPFARKLTPNNTSFISCGKKYHITAVFNEQLVEINGQKAGYKVTVKNGWSAEENSKIENFTWDGDRTVEFDFTPSDQLADNYADYTFQITGLQGIGSLKAPDSFIYSAKIKISICAHRNEGIYLNLGAKPKLLEPMDIFCGDWVNENNQKLRDVKNIVLTASKPEVVVESDPAKQSGEMLEKIEGKLPDECTIVKSATYDLKLMTCNENILSTGSSVRLHIGFPEGFGPENAGVSYKAYHFTRDKNGTITGVEELDCIVTDKGLIVTCYSFSPFAVVALKGEPEADTISQKLLIMNTEGGDAVFQEDKNNKICTISEKGQKRTIAIDAKEGYRISGLYLNNIALKVTDSKSMKYTVKSEDLKGGGNILDVVFVKDNPKQETAPSTQDKPSAGKQENQASQSGSENAASYNSANNAAGNNTVNSTANSQPAAPKTDSVPVVVLPQGDGNTAVTDQAAAVPPAASATPPAASTAPPKTSASSAAGTTITGNIVSDAGANAAGTGNDTAEALIPDTDVELEHIVLSTGEDGMDLVVLPADAAASDKEQPGMLGILLKVLIGVVAVSMVAVAVVGFIQFRRDRYDSE
jgi:transglutaminase-like putative cysteine protease